MASRKSPTRTLQLLAAALLLAVLAVVVWGPQRQPEESADEEETVIEGTLVVRPDVVEAVQVLPEPPAPAPVQPAPDLKPPPPAAPKPPPALVEVTPPAPEPEVEQALPLRQLVGTRKVSAEDLLKDLEEAIVSGRWLAYREQLQGSVAQTIEQIPGTAAARELTGLLEEQSFQASLLRWKMLKLFPPSLWVAASELPGFPEFCRHALGRAEVMEEVLMTVQREDDPIQTLDRMVRLWSSHEEQPELAAKYFNLALACAVVFDREVNYVQASEDYSSSIDAETRYQWYVNQNERGYLEVSIDRSPARDLTFVVCAPVTESELEWAVKEYRSLRRKSWGRTYGEIEYLMERAVEGLDPYDTYTLEEIQEEGGICGDQTHFCVNTARAAGIPALGLSGVTDAGPHAWAAVKVEDDEWSTQIGRIKGVSRGRAVDPQTGATITEQDLWMWSSREYRRSSRRLGVWRQLWLAELFGEMQKPEWQREAVRAAQRDGEPFPEYWQALYQAMKADPKFIEQPEDSSTLRSWSDLCDELKREFKDNPRMAQLATQIETEHLFPYLELGDIRRQLARDRRRQQREAAEQTDLVTTSLKREADWIQTKLGDEEEGREQALREISQLYDRSLREYGKSVSAFSVMADDYFGYVKDEKEIAAKAVRDIDLAFKRVVDTDSDDWFRAQTEVGIHRRICDMYRHVGEVKRAEVMERRLETQMERARRKAL